MQRRGKYVESRKVIIVLWLEYTSLMFINYIDKHCLDREREKDEDDDNAERTTV